MVAIKAFRFDEVTPEQAAEFAVELEDLAANQPRHPGIAAALAAGVEGVTPYLAQEYVAGEALDAALRQYGPPPSGDTVTTLRRVADALDRAAGDGIHHGTLHPRDILITDGGDARVIDLGVAQALMRSGLRLPVRRPYSAPERVAGQAWGGAADIYSLGAIAFELMTGRRVPGPGRPDVSAPGRLATTAESLAEALAKALSEEPAARYPSAADLVDALAPLLPSTKRSTRRRSQPSADTPLLLEIGDPAAMATAADDAMRPAVMIPPVDDEKVGPADLPLAEAAAPARFASFDAPLEPAPEPLSVELSDEPLGDRERPLHGSWPPPPSLVLPVERRPLVPLIIALIVGIAAGFGWGYWTAFRTIEPVAGPAPAAAGAHTASQAPVRVDEPEVIGERNLPSPAATPQAPATRTSPSPATPRVTERPPTPRPSAPAAEPRRTSLPPGRLVVHSTPPGAQVRVDGRVRGKTPLVLRDMPLRVVRVTVAHDGYKPDERRVALSAAQPAVTVEARLATLAPPAPEATTGVLVVESRPSGATVFVDGRQVGVTPMSLPDQTPGTHRIRIEMTGFSPWVTTAAVQAGVRTRVAASLERGTSE